jgi:hypothetical protein
MNGKKQMVYYDLITNLQNKAPPSDSKKVSTIYVTSAYNTKSEVMGNKIIYRGKKESDRFENPYPKAGDFPERKVIGYSNYAIECEINDYTDKMLRVQVNKSHLKLADIYRPLMNAVQDIIDRYNKATYKKHIKPFLPKTKVEESSDSDTNSIENKKKTTQNLVDKLITDSGVKKPNAAPLPDTPRPPPPSLSLVKTSSKPIIPTLAVPIRRDVSHSSVSHTPSPLSKNVEPTTLIAPISNPPANVDIFFSKTPEYLIVSEKNNTIYKVPYVGQYKIWEDLYVNVLKGLGHERFKEWMTEHNKANHLLR